MPIRAPRICGACGRVVAAGVQCACRIKRKAEIDRQRPSARERGYDSAWDKARAGFLAHHPRCIRCGAPATVVNHVIPHRGDRKLFWDSNNWAAVCKPCHDGPIQSEEKSKS